MRIKMHFHYCFTIYAFIEVENDKMLIGKNNVGEKGWKFLWSFLIFPCWKVFPEEASPEKVFQSCPNDKISINIFTVILKQNLLHSRLFEESFSRKGEKGKYQGDKFSFYCEETLTLTEIESREN